MSTVNGALTCSIANGETTSGAIDLGELALVGIQIPSSITSATLSFQGSYDGTTYCAITTRDGTAYTVTISASKLIMIPPADLAGVRFLKVVTASAEGVARSIALLTRAV